MTVDLVRSKQLSGTDEVLNVGPLEATQAILSALIDGLLLLWLLQTIELGLQFLQALADFTVVDIKLFH